MNRIRKNDIHLTKVKHNTQINMKAAMLVAAILELSGFPPLVMSFESEDLDLKPVQIRSSDKRYEKLNKRYLTNGPILRGKNWW